MTAQDIRTASLALSDLTLDPFEHALLPVMRHFLTAFTTPESHAWHLAYATAAERWGTAVGLSVAQGLSDVVRATVTCRPGDLCHNDPLAGETRDRVTVDEAMLLLTLHYMRRDNTDRARVAVENLTHGKRDPRLIRAALSFARRHNSGASPAAGDQSRPALSLVG